jgi:hypothetical protein
VTTAKLPTLLPNPGEPLPASLEARFASLEGAVAKLATRVAVLEGSPQKLSVALEAAPPSAPAPMAELPSAVQTLGLIGRVCLILGGATLIRALVEAGTLRRGWGVALGLVYAVSWALLADRAKRSMDASFHALASILIA